MKTLLRVAAGALSLALFGATAVAVNAELAVSTKRAITITDEVRIRPNPNTQNSELAWMPAGATPTYICYVDGENVGGTTKWFKVGWNGVEGYYSSIADDVPLSLQGDILGNYGIPQCGTGADINQGSGADLMVNPAPLNYDRESAVAWGLAHARDTQPWTWSGCTWFLSQALWYGGFHQTDAWNASSKHGGRVQTLPGTVAATTAPELLKYLAANGLVTITPLGSGRIHDNAVPEAQLGDAIAFDWATDRSDPPRVDNGFKGITHLALITNIAPGQYPEVSEWGTAVWPSANSSYVKRGWTWSENDHTWLQRKSPDVTALLIHFN